MNRPRQLQKIVLLSVCATLAPTIIHAQEAVPAVPYKNVPEITAYIKKQIIADLGDDGITAAKLDLSSPPDGVAEYVIMYDNRGFCGSAGCTVEVVRIKPSGEIETLAGILQYGFGLAYTHTNGLRDLLSEGRSGKFIWRFDGKEYKPHKGHPRAAVTPPTSTPASTKTTQSKTRTPGCVGEYGWSGGHNKYGRLRDGYASFANCTDPMNRVLTLSCRSEKNLVEVMIDPDMKLDPEKKTFGLLIEIDGKRTIRPAGLFYSELAGHLQPALQLRKNDPLLRALARGKVASFAGGKKRIRIHLNGAARAIKAMRKGC